jgi:hypothetical protein
MNHASASAAPKFSIRSRHASARALVVAVLSASIVTGFVAQYWRAPVASPRDAFAASIAPAAAPATARLPRGS